MHTRNTPWFSCATLLIFVAPSFGDEAAFRSYLTRRADAVRPTAAELRWQEIPWLISLVEARDLAQKERRPILVWAADDDPFGRC